MYGNDRKARLTNADLCDEMVWSPSYWFVWFSIGLVSFERSYEYVGPSFIRALPGISAPNKPPI